MAPLPPLPAIASDEDMRWAYLLATDADSQEAAEFLLRGQSESQWGIRLGGVRFVCRQWFKVAEPGPGHDEGDLEKCEPDDPARDSEWWVFGLDEDHELLSDLGVPAHERD